MGTRRVHQSQVNLSSSPATSSGSPSGTTPARSRRLVQKTPDPWRRPLYYRPLFWAVLLLGALGASGVSRGYRVWRTTEAQLPAVSQLLTYERNGTITIQADDGTVLQKIGPATREKLAYDDIPSILIAAFIAAEDQRFYEHQGVDSQAIARALLANVRQRDVVEGASTITQQLARIAFLDQQRSFQRKTREALLALKISETYEKSVVLERYLNLVYLGAGAYGVADAAWIYFGKSVADLTLSESALIAGMAPAPSVYSPLVDPEAARQQRNIVIRRMLENGSITQAEASTAIASDIVITPKEPKFLYSEFPYFTIYIQKQLNELLPPEVIEAGGLNVETTLNIDWQRKAQTTIRETVETTGKRQRFSQASLVAIDPRSGEIKAVVGGTDFNESQFNRATQAHRQPGSTFKTFVYTTAIAAGFSPHKTYADTKFVVDGYEPKNYSNRYSGTVDINKALTSSINIVAVKVLIDVGFEPVIEMAKRMGIESELRPTYSLALGASEVTLLELTSAYGTLATQGKHTPAHGIRRILDSSGAVIYESDTTV
ncbi:MAG: penicillin-binding protein, partial [Leptolyngbya sp. SIO1D8]|nr:penicillin-binding protein [Leptolyngbya sp. SIO1D8]